METLSPRGTWVRRWHRRLGVVACIGVLAWSLSGISHPLMTRLQPRPATPAPPAQSLDLVDALPLAQVLARAGIAQVAGARIVRFAPGQFYQVTLPGHAERLYFSLRDGAPLRGGDRAFAEHLARHFSGESSARVVSAAAVTGFDNDYPSVNRLLPAWRVQFDRPDNLRAYVDTGSSRLGTLVDDRKALLAGWFRTLHTWSFAGEGYWLRVAAMTVLLAAALFTALAGTWLYAVRWRQPAKGLGLRRWHRTIGIWVSVSTVLFAVTGAWHAWQSHARDVAVPTPNAERFPATVFTTSPAAWQAAPGDAVASVVGDEVAWRVVHAAGRKPQGNGTHAGHAGHGAAPPERAEQVEYRSATTGALLPNAEQLRAAAIARRAAGAQGIRQIEPVTRFGGEYGFVFKRLPVHRVTLDDGVRYYVETASGEIAARVDDSDAREGWAFATLHKWDGLKALVGTDARDAVVALFALGNAGVAVLGLALFLRRR